MRSGLRHRGFTLIELLVVVAILCAMAGVGVLSVRGGMGAVRVRGAARDVYAAIRHARSQALVSQSPVIVTYSSGRAGSTGETTAEVKVDGARLFTAGVDRSKVRKITGGGLASVGGRAAEEQETEGSLVEDVLFAPISEDVVRGMRLKVVMGDDDVLEQSEGVRSGPKVSVFSNVDYLLRRYRESASANPAAEMPQTESAAVGAAADAEIARGIGEDASQPPVSVVFEPNGRVDPHQLWVYADGQRPEDGLLVRVDRFGGVQVVKSDGSEGGGR